MPSFRTAANTFCLQLQMGERLTYRGNNTAGGHSGFRETDEGIYYREEPYLPGWEFCAGAHWPIVAVIVGPNRTSTHRIETAELDWRIAQVYETEAFPEPAPETTVWPGCWFLTTTARVTRRPALRRVPVYRLRVVGPPAPTPPTERLAARLVVLIPPQRKARVHPRRHTPMLRTWHTGAEPPATERYATRQIVVGRARRRLRPSRTIPTQLWHVSPVVVTERYATRVMMMPVRRHTRRAPGRVTVRLQTMAPAPPVVPGVRSRWWRIAIPIGIGV